jgi:hypothetical protein
MTTHARARELERYGLVLTEADFSAMMTMIDRGESLLRRRLRDGSETHTLTYMGKSLNVVFMPKSSAIVTVRPPGGKLMPPRDKGRMRRAHPARDG